MEQTPAKHYPKVPPAIVDKLKQNGAEITYLDLDLARVAPMLWRFLVADDYSVDVFIVRDADSLLTARDAAVVNPWLASGQPFHCIRDHPSHANYPVSGGMWGARRRDFITLLDLQSTECLMLSYNSAYLQDMDFLGSVIWPKVKAHAYCHDSVSCTTYPNSHPFPVRRVDLEHVGEVYDKEGNGREIDFKILRNTPINSNCEPPRLSKNETVA